MEFMGCVRSLCGNVDWKRLHLRKNFPNGKCQWDGVRPCAGLECKYLLAIADVEIIGQESANDRLHDESFRVALERERHEGNRAEKGFSG